MEVNLRLQVVMECSRTPMSLAAVDLFEIFMDYIEICFLRQQRANPSQIYSSLLTEILYGDLDNPFIIAERAKAADVPFTGHLTPIASCSRITQPSLSGALCMSLWLICRKQRSSRTNTRWSYLIFTIRKYAKAVSFQFIKTDFPAFKTRRHVRCQRRIFFLG